MNQNVKQKEVQKMTREEQTTVQKESQAAMQKALKVAAGNGTQSVGKRMDVSKRETAAFPSGRIRLIFLNIVGCLLAGINTFSFAPAGIGYFAALNMSKSSGMVSVFALILGMYTHFPRIIVFKNATTLLAIIIIYRLLSIGKLRISEKAAAAIAGSIMLIMEISDYTMTHSMRELNRIQLINLMLIGAFSVMTGLLCMIFRKAVNAVLVEKHAYSNDEMLGFSVIAGMLIYSLGQNFEVPFAGVEIAVFFMILYAAYKHGIGMGALVGLAVSVPVCLWSHELSYLGMICMIAILVGLFRELGRLASATTMLILGAVSYYAIYPDIAPQGYETGQLGHNIMKGMLGAAVIFMMLPKSVIYRREENTGDGDTDGIKNMYEERLMNVAKTFEYLSKMLFGDGNSEEGMLYEIQNGAGGQVQAGEMADAIWKNRLKESRVIMSEQLEQISKIIEDYSKKVYDFVRISDEQEEYIRHRLKGRKVYIDKIVGLSNSRNRREYLVTAKCGRGVTVGSREIAQVISDAMGRRYIPSKNCRKLISTEFTTTTYVEEANFYVVHAKKKKARGDNGISGDNYSLRELDNGHLLMGLSDGMGYGTSACIESETVIELLEQLLDSGFDAECALKMINSVMVMHSEEDHPATLDYGVIDLHSGICDMVKIGAAATFVKRGSWVETIKSTSMPLGIFATVDYDSASKKLYNGDMIIMVSDGVIDAMNCENKDERLGEIISTIESSNPKEMAEAILNRAVADKTKLADDMTVLVTEIWENSKVA